MNIPNLSKVRKAYILTSKTAIGLLSLLAAVELFLGHRPDSLKYDDLPEDSGSGRESYFLIYRITKSVKFGIFTYYIGNLIGEKGY